MPISARGVAFVVLVLAIAVSGCGRINFQELDAPQRDGALDGGRDGAVDGTVDGAVDGGGDAAVDGGDGAVPTVRWLGTLTGGDATGAASFGWRLASSGTRVVVGARAHDHDGLSRMGAAFVFDEDAAQTLGVEESAELLASDRSSDDWFGQAVALDGDLVVVGRWSDYTLHTEQEVGKAYVFRSQGDGSYAEVGQLLASDGALGHNFATAVGAAGASMAIVGAPYHTNSTGKVYVFRDNLGVWEQTQALLASDLSSASQFGATIAVDPTGTRMAIGAPKEDAIARDAGAVYIFERAGDGSWSETAKLVASNAQADALLGASVSLDGNRLLACADHDGGDVGRCYVFVRDVSGQWNEEAQLVGMGLRGGDLFGGSAALRGERALIGAPGRDTAFIFTRNADRSWTQLVELLSRDTSAGDLAGYSVAMTDSLLFVGAPRGNYVSVFSIEPG